MQLGANQDSLRTLSADDKGQGVLWVLLLLEVYKHRQQGQAVLFRTWANSTEDYTITEGTIANKEAETFLTCDTISDALSRMQGRLLHKSSCDPRTILALPFCHSQPTSPGDFPTNSTRPTSHTSPRDPLTNNPW
jgi:hypothetical protein